MRFGWAVVAIGLAASPAMAAQLSDSVSAGAAVVRMPVDPAGFAFADCATQPDTAVCGTGGAADVRFVDMADPRRAVSPTSFSLLAMEEGAELTAYDAAGRAIGSARGSGDGERVTLIGPIARIAVRPAAAPVTKAANGIAAIRGDAAAAMSHVPEPATWAMLMLGFAMIAAGVRYCLRRSEARFDDHVRRIAAGELI